MMLWTGIAAIVMVCLMSFALIVGLVHIGTACLDLTHLLMMYFREREELKMLEQRSLGLASCGSETSFAIPPEVRYDDE